MRKLVLVPLAAIALVIPACGSGDDASREDAHDVRGNLIDKSKPHSVAFNNHYGNVETKCLGNPPIDVDGAPQGSRPTADTADNGGGWRIVITTNEHNDRLILVQDPDCPGYVKGADLPAAVNATP